MNGNSFLTSTLTRSRTSPSTASWRWTHCGAHLSTDYVSTLNNFHYYVVLLILTRQSLLIQPSPFSLETPPDCNTSPVSTLLPGCNMPSTCMGLPAHYSIFLATYFRWHSEVFQCPGLRHTPLLHPLHKSSVLFFSLLINLCHSVAPYHARCPFTAQSPLTIPLLLTHSVALYHGCRPFSAPSPLTFRCP